MGSVASGVPGLIERSYSLTIPTGKVHALVGVTTNATALPFLPYSCDLEVDTEVVPFVTVTDSWTITGEGTGILATGDLDVDPASRVLKKVRVTCNGFTSVGIDWIVLQNTSDEVPPGDDAVVEWSDPGMPGGGFVANIVRTADGHTLWAGSDVGGVASVDKVSPVESWRARSGDPALGALTSHPDLAVWDVLPTTWGDTFILTGRWVDGELLGGVWRSQDDGDSWEELIDSRPTVSDATEVTIAGIGDSGACGTKIEAGGALLVEEPDTEGVYIANEDAEDLGLHFYDGINFCPIMVFSEMGVTATIGAMARVVSLDNELPGLLVGYRGDDGTTDSLYLCTLPESGGVVTLDCSTWGSVTCEPVAGPTGADIRDIEVDPNDPSVAYVADGGDDPTLDKCADDGVGGVYRLDIGDDGSVLEAADWTNLSSGLSSVSADHAVTGVEMDPDSQFLVAFVPVSSGKAFDFDRMYRIAADDLAADPFAGGWVPINDAPTDEAAREANLYLNAGWLDESTATTVLPRRHPAQYAPGFGIDGVWYQDGSDPTLDGCDGGGYEYRLAISTKFHMWSVAGMDADCDGSGWDPATDTEWEFWPEPTYPFGFIWQTTSATDAAFDAAGNAWVPVKDLGLFQRPAGVDEAEVDCLWNNLAR